jgi:hypothetical protein
MTRAGLPFAVIRDQIGRSAVIPFLGAGASMGEGLPSGYALMRQLADDASFPGGEKTLATVAQWYQLVSGRRPLNEALRGVFTTAQVRPLPVHRWLASIAAPLLIITTNYDDLIEQAFRDADRPYDVVVHTTDDDCGELLLCRRHGAREPELVDASALDIPLDVTTVIYKMHGGIDRELASRDQYVITEDDYIEFLVRLADHKAIPSIFAEPFEQRHFLFLGYGLRDWNLRVVLHRVQKDLHRAGDMRSWAVDAKPSRLEQRFWSQRGVEVAKMTIQEFLDGIAA